MKTFIFILFMLLTGSLSYGQNRAERLGNNEFHRYNYTEAIERFEPIRNKSIDIQRKLAQSHLFLGNISKAADYYAGIVSSDEKKSQDVWEYAQTLMMLERYDDARKQLNTFYQLSPDDSRAKRYSQAGSFDADIKAMETNTSIKHLSINNVQQDFGVSYYDGQVLFASSRQVAADPRDNWVGNQLPYLFPFSAGKSPDGEMVNPKPFMPDFFEGDYHVGPVVFNKAVNMMAYVVNYEPKSKKGETLNLKLMVSVLDDGEWSEPVSAPFNSPDYSVGHATFTPDGGTMYFVSDMPGGKGGTDIYRVSVSPSGVFGIPENVEEINTEGQEMFPFFHQDNRLYFASDGHVGLGGLDIFYADISEGRFGEVVNVGTPINSARDDFAIAFNEDGKTGYFSSRRLGGSGNDDIYYFSVTEPKPEAEPEPIVIVEPEPVVQPEIVKVLDIGPILFDFDKSNIRPDAAIELDKLVRIMNENPTMVVEIASHTDCRGSDAYNEVLSKSRLESTQAYIRQRITRPERIYGKSYGKTELLNRCDCLTEDPPCTPEEHEVNRRSEFRIISQ